MLCCAFNKILKIADRSQLDKTEVVVAIMDEIDNLQHTVLQKILETEGKNVVIGICNKVRIVYCCCIYYVYRVI